MVSPNQKTALCAAAIAVSGYVVAAQTSSCAPEHLPKDPGPLPSPRSFERTSDPVRYFLFSDQTLPFRGDLPHLSVAQVRDVLEKAVDKNLTFAQTGRRLAEMGASGVNEEAGPEQIQVAQAFNRILADPQLEVDIRERWKNYVDAHAQVVNGQPAVLSQHEARSLRLVPLSAVFELGGVLDKPDAEQLTPRSIWYDLRELRAWSDRGNLAGEYLDFKDESVSRAFTTFTNLNPSQANPICLSAPDRIEIALALNLAIATANQRKQEDPKFSRSEVKHFIGVVLKGLVQDAVTHAGPAPRYSVLFGQRGRAQQID